MKRFTRLSTLVFLLVASAISAGAQTGPTTQPQNLPPGVRTESDLKYGSAPGRGQLLDLYLPEAASAPLPLIVWIHGGAWKEGDKRGCPAVAMVPRGYAVASLNYRLTNEAVFPAQIQDCKGAIRWLRAHAKQYHLDADHIGVWGASAGGHLVALLGTSGDAKELEGDVGGNLDQSSRVQCVIDWFGPTDLSVFTDQSEHAAPLATGKHDYSPITALFGGPISAHPDLVRLANPLTFIKRENPPFLIMHGDKDPIVPLAQSEILADALKRAGVETHLEVLPGAGHGNGFGKPSLLAMMVSFMDKHLKSTEN